MTGSEWLSGQAFCNLHFTLAISEGIKSMLVTFQSDIGADQLFPKTVIFQMNIEDNIVIIQILDCWMRLTSSRWQARTWNKYKFLRLCWMYEIPKCWPHVTCKSLWWIWRKMSWLGLSSWCLDGMAWYIFWRTKPINLLPTHCIKFDGDVQDVMGRPCTGWNSCYSTIHDHVTWS